MKANRALIARIVMATLVALAGVASAAQPIGCLIEPDAVAEIGSPIAGVIQTVLVERGDRVTRGQVLAVLRNDVERAALETARTRSIAKGEEGMAIANFDLARQKLTRSEELVRHKFISQQALEQAKAEYEMAEQRLAQAREQQSALANELALARARLEDRNIRSPIDGIVTERYLAAGERVEDKPVLRVAKVQPLRVEVVMPGAAFGTISTGMAGRILPDMRGGAPVEAKVSLVDQVLDAPSNTFRVRLRLANPDGAIPAGVRCKADLGGTGVEAKSAPSGAPVARDASSAALKLDRELTATPKAGREMSSQRKAEPEVPVARKPDPAPPVVRKSEPPLPAVRKSDPSLPSVRVPEPRSPAARKYGGKVPAARMPSVNWPVPRALNVRA